MARKGGKWAAIVARLGLPKLEELDPIRAAAIEAVQNEILAERPDPEPESEAPAIPGSDTRARLDEISKKFDELLAVRKRAARGHWASEFGRGWAEMRLVRDRIKELDSAANLVLEAYQRLMLDQMEAEGVESQRLPAVGLISTHQEPHAQVKDKDAFLEYCLKDPDLKKKLALPWQTANELTKRLLEAGEQPPPGVSVWAQTKVALRQE